MSNAMLLPALLQQLQDARVNLAASKAMIADLRAQFDASIAGMLDDQKVQADTVVLIENQVREVARAEFLETGDRKPAPGVEIKMHAILEFDAALADAWTKARGVCRIPETLDSAAFAKLVKSGAITEGLEFVTERTEPKVSIATDLAKALGNAEAAHA